MQLRNENIPWSEIAERLGRNLKTCHSRFSKQQIQDTQREWSAENDEALKAAYKRKKADLWTQLGREMGFSGNWRVIEKKVFEQRLSSLK